MQRPCEATRIRVVSGIKSASVILKHDQVDSVLSALCLVLSSLLVRDAVVRAALAFRGGAAVSAVMGARDFSLKTPVETSMVRILCMRPETLHRQETREHGT